MARKSDSSIEENGSNVHPLEDKEDEAGRLNRMLAAVMKYISDDAIVEIDIAYLLENTTGLRKWWDEYREKDRKRIAEEINKSLGGLTLEELEKIRAQIKGQKEKQE